MTLDIAIAIALIVVSVIVIVLSAIVSWSAIVVIRDIRPSRRRAGRRGGYIDHDRPYGRRPL